MATIETTDDDIVVKLSGREMMASLHGNVRVPRSAVTKVKTVDNGFRHLRGMRAPGAEIPRVLAVGTWRRLRSKDFVALRRGRRAVVIDLSPGAAKFRRLLVSVDDADAVEAAVGMPPPQN